MNVSIAGPLVGWDLRLNHDDACSSPPHMLTNEKYHCRNDGVCGNVKGDLIHGNFLIGASSDTQQAGDKRHGHHVIGKGRFRAVLDQHKLHKDDQQ